MLAIIPSEATSPSKGWREFIRMQEKNGERHRAAGIVHPRAETSSLGLVMRTIRWRYAIAAAAPLPACHAGAGIRVEPPLTAEVTYAQPRGRYDLYRIRLRAAGENATGRLLRPHRGGGPFPAVLLNDGRELNSATLDYLPAEFGDVVVLSLDYPKELPYEFDPLTLVLASDQIRRELRRIPRLFSLGGAYLTQRADVDSSRIAMVVTSFAAPFGVLAAAEDRRFRNVGLIYGAGDLGRVLEANLTLEPRFLRSVAGWLTGQLYGEFEPTRYIAGIAPRPLIMVNGRDDPQMPVQAVRVLYAAAREPKTLIWLPTGHLMPTDRALIRALVDTTLARLPVLQRGQTGRRRKRGVATGRRARRSARPALRERAVERKFERWRASGPAAVVRFYGCREWLRGVRGLRAALSRLHYRRSDGVPVRSRCRNRRTSSNSVDDPSDDDHDQRDDRIPRQALPRIAGCHVGS
jgi:hypothetical protein